MRFRIRSPLVAMAIVLAITPMAAGQTTLAPTWVATPNVGLFDLGQGIAVASDGTMFATGTTQSTAKDRDIVNVRVASDGTLVWAKAIDLGADDRAEDMTLANGGLFVAGSTRTPLGDDAILMRIDPATGNLLWTKSFDKGTNEVGRALAPSNGAIYMAGVSMSLHGGDAFVAKFDLNGTELWSRPINMYQLDEAFGVSATSDGGVLVSGRLLDSHIFTAFLRKYDKDGDLEWTTYVPATSDTEGRGAAGSPTGLACLTGTIVSPGTNGTQKDLLVSCFEADSAVAWERTIDVSGDDDEGRDAVFDPSGNLIVTGFGKFPDGKAPFVIKLSPEGTTVWQFVGTPTSLSGTGSIALSPDGSIIGVAGAQQRGASDFDFLVMRFDQGIAAAAFRVSTTSPKSGEPIKFEDASRSTGSRIQSWQWEFGDGKTSDKSSPTHIYEWGGSYDVRLTIRDAFNNLGTYAQGLTVAGPPKPFSDPSTDPGKDPNTPTTKSEKVPGFGVVLAVVAIALVASRLRRR